MVQLNDIKKHKNRRKKKRVGRGGKRGTYAGRGLNGQRANAGGRMPSPKREQIKKFPKLAGLKNKSNKLPTKVVNVGDLESFFGEIKEITPKTAMEKGLIHKKSDPVKILGEGNIASSIIVKDIPVSKSAKEKIEKAGGQVIDK